MSPNVTIRIATQMTASNADVFGNVLVIKHAHGQKHAVVDCQQEDVAYISTIISMLVHSSTNVAIADLGTGQWRYLTFGLENGR